MIRPEPSGRPVEPQCPVAPAIRVQQLAVDIPHPRSRYRAPTPALHDISFTAPRGQVTALVGTNGAGKTTVLRALTGALRPAAGSIEVLGRTVGPADRACPEGVGVVPDAPVLPEEWTAQDVIALRRCLGDPFDTSLFPRMLQASGIRPRAMIGSLSAGQTTAFAVAAALATDPRLLVLDEPLTRLDPLARSTLVDLLRDRLTDDDSRSVLLSTHDLEGMDCFVDHLVVLHEGRTVLEGDVDELLEAHVVATYPAGAPQIPLGARPLGRSGAAEALIATDDSVGLAPGTALREPDLPDLVGLTLAARAGRAIGEDRR